MHRDMHEGKNPAPGKRAAVLTKTAFESLRDAGGSLPFRDVRAAARRRVSLRPRELCVRRESVLEIASKGR